MKKIKLLNQKLLYISICLLLSFSSCKKEEKTALAQVTTGTITDIELTSAKCKSTINDDGNATVTERGVCWGTGNTPTITDFKTTNGTGTGEFISQITGLVPGTSYYVRAYAVNSVGTSYGTALLFTTKAITVPVLTVVTPTSITQTTAISGGVITGDGGVAITERGVCWSTNTTPSIDDFKTSNGSGTGSFESDISGLAPNTTYYLKAYATNSVGTGYSDAVSFKTTEIKAPTITISAITNITTTTAKTGGNVTDEGGVSVTARGICWGLITNPTINDSITVNGSGYGDFSSDLTGLAPNTMYYVRAYATNGSGTGYSDVVSFNTQPIQLPQITTSSVTAITQTTATCGGNITNDGGGAISARGICWSTSPNPTISDNYVGSGGGTGTFTADLVGLSVWNTHYVRAYATNIAGTAYGNQISFLR